MRKFIPAFVDHLSRYIFATERAYKKNVIDLGSRDGFGSVLLSYAADQLTLADVNEKYLKAAETEITFRCPTKFIQCDFEKEFPEGKWDMAVAFEVIEHLENCDFFIKNIAEHLEAGGHLVFSVPEMVANHEHKTLFDEQKIKDLISKYLKITEFYRDDFRAYTGAPRYAGVKGFLGVARKIDDSVYDEKFFDFCEPNCGRGSRNARLARIILKHNPKKVLDVGCGRGHLVRLLLDKGIDATGADISSAAGTLIPNNFIKCDAKKLPFKDKEFDVVSCIETLEHIAITDVEETINELKRVGKIVVANVCCKPDKYPISTHLTVKPMEWWKQFDIEVF